MGLIKEEIFLPEFSIKIKIELIEEFLHKKFDEHTIREYLRSREMYNSNIF